VKLFGNSLVRFTVILKKLNMIVTLFQIGDK